MRIGNSAFFIGTLSFPLLIIACSSGSDETSAKRPARQQAGTGFSIVGLSNTVWETDCLAQEDQSSSAIVTFQIENTEVRKSTRYFHGEACAPEELFATRGAVYIHANVSNSPDVVGGKLMRGSLEAVTFAALRDDFTAELNTGAVYGMTDWMTGVQKDVSGKTYDNTSSAEPSPGKSLQLTYTIEDDKMYFAWHQAGGGIAYDRAEPYHRKNAAQPAE